MMDREKVKVLIECSTSFEKADRIMSEYTRYKTLKEKIAFLEGMFDPRVVTLREDDTDELKYRFLLEGIIRQKFL